MNMNLNNKKYFEINCFGAVDELENYNLLFDKCKTLKIMGVSEENHNKITLDLENGKKCSIVTVDNKYIPFLLQIKNRIQSEHLNKTLKEVLERDFSIAEKI